LNQEEAASLSGRSISDLRLFSSLAKLVKEMVVVTQGNKGAVVYDSQDRKLIAGSFKSKTADSTGAGDSFGCGFIGGLAKGFCLEEALRLGTANGASVVTQIGAKTGLLKIAQLKRWFQRPLKIEWEKSGR
ncbi:carbohydrate kinase family protein, partial [Patescibacteria group bacterium]|nr:carbohydrate kinase family protein [Patescibacteria group bacterium]